MISVRTLRENEAMPEGFNTGFEKMPLLGDWIWVAEKDGKAVGILMAAPMHGIAYMMRLCILKGSSKLVAVFLLRTCMKDCQERGYKGYLMHVNPVSEVDRRFIPLARRAGAIQLLTPQLMIAGSVEQAVRL